MLPSLCEARVGRKNFCIQLLRPRPDGGGVVALRLHAALAQALHLRLRGARARLLLVQLPLQLQLLRGPARQRASTVFDVRVRGV